MRMPSLEESKDPVIKMLLEYAGGSVSLLESCMMKAAENSRNLVTYGGLSVSAIKAEIDSYNAKQNQKLNDPIHAALKAVVLNEDLIPHRQVIIDCLSEQLNK